MTARGNARQTLFLDDEDRRAFLETLADAASRFAVCCYTYCLMGNHYHLLLETRRANLSRAMRHVNGVYAQSFNRRYERVGHVFQGRYHAILIERDEHLLALARYVVMNLVRARLCRRPEDWAWSSYSAAVGLARPHPCLDLAGLLDCFAADRRTAAARYRAFVEEQTVATPWHELRGQIYLGSDEFVEAVSKMRPARSAEIPRRQRLPVRPPIASLIEEHGERGALLAYREFDYSLREIAEHLRRHVSTVSLLVRALERQEPPTVRDFKT